MNPKCSYFNERILNCSSICNEKVYSYWCKLIGDEAVDNLSVAYNTTVTNIVDGSFLTAFNLHFSIIFEKISDDFRSHDWEELETIRLDENTQFSNYYSPLLKFGVFIYNKYIPNIVSNKLLDAYKKMLFDKLSTISTGTLVQEIHIAKKLGQLSGLTTKEEYEYFNNVILKQADYLTNLFDIYPVLQRLIFESIINCCNYFYLLSKRLLTDREKIIKDIYSGNTFSQIDNIQIGISDSHHHSSEVAIITLDNNNKIVYKPHSLKIEKAFQTFSYELSKSTSYPLKPIKIVEGDEYGWEEFIEFKSCKKQQEINAYYYRFGEILFLSYILNTTDMHYENLIAFGEYPIIIDCETVMDNNFIPQIKSATDLINQQLGESVLYSGLLPSYRYVQNGQGINLSAINGEGGSEIPITVPTLKDLGTSDVHFEYKHPHTKNNNNLALLNNQFLEPKNFVKYICQGFCDLYTYALNNKENILNKITLFSNINIRHLIQDTQRYSMLLHTSYHPDFLQNGSDRQLLLCTLLKNINTEQRNVKIAIQEISDMLEMDIPYFYGNTSSTNLYGSSGTIVNNYFQKTSLELAISKINSLSFTDLKLQRNYIQLALSDADTYHSPFKSNKHVIPFEMSSQIVNSKTMEALDVTYHRLIKAMVSTKDHTSVSWINITGVGTPGHSGWSVKPIGAYLYDGFAGISIFFHALNKLTSFDKNSEICNAIDQELFKYTDKISNFSGSSVSLGAFVGETSILYSYLISYKITNNVKYKVYARKHFSIINDYIEEEENCDIVFGLSGILITLLRFYSIEQDKTIYDKAIVVGKKIISSQLKCGGWPSVNKDCPLTGFSHGTAGILYALTELYRITPYKEIKESVRKGLEFERSQYDCQAHNWKDNRPETPKGTFMNTWCHGSAGILFSRTKMLGIFSPEIDQIVHNDILSALETSSSSVFASNCLCHGNLGNSEIFREYYEKSNNPMALQKSIELCANAINNIFEPNLALPPLYDYSSPGLMTGLSGVGYSLLRTIDHSLPCILGLDI